MILMGPFKLSIALYCFLALAILHTTHAQNSQQDYLNAHNSARAQVGVASISWNTTLAAYAQNYANQRINDCNLVASVGPFGENIGKGSSGTFTGTAAVNLWIGEKTYYDDSTKTCATGQVCAHYTQVVWSNSNQLGCARVQCTNNWYFLICSYSPRGNIAGEHPY